MRRGLIAAFVVAWSASGWGAETLSTDGGTPAAPSASHDSSLESSQSADSEAIGLADAGAVAASADAGVSGAHPSDLPVSTSTSPSTSAPTAVAVQATATSSVAVQAAAQPEPGVARAKPPVSLSDELGRALPFAVRATVEHRQKAVVDTTPANDRWTYYELVASYSVAEKLGVFARLGVTQLYAVPVGTSPARFEDMALGLSTRHMFSLSGLGIPFLAGKELSTRASLRAWLPTSRQSIRRELVVAPELRASARLAFLNDRLKATIDARFTYRYHLDGNRAGPRSTDNIRFVPFLRPMVEADVANFGRWGTLGVGADISWSWINLYPSADPGDDVKTSARAPWQVFTGWSVGAFYRPRPWASVNLSIDHNGDLPKNAYGVYQVLHRDQTALVVSAEATF